MTTVFPFPQLDSKVRVWIYGIAVLAAPILVAWGKVADSEAQLYLGFLAAFLGVTTAAANAPTQERIAEVKSEAVAEYVESRDAEDTSAHANVPQENAPAGDAPYEGI